MANTTFQEWEHSMFGSPTHSAISVTTDDLKIVMVDEGTDTPSPSTDTDLADIAAGARVDTSPNLGGKSLSSGAFKGSATTFSATTGATVESLVMYKDSGAAATSPLMLYIDTATGLDLTPNGSDVIVTPSTAGWCHF